MRPLHAAVLPVLCLWPRAQVDAQAITRAPEVRQLVTFLWQPGKSAEALRIYGESLRPIYQANPDLLRFRAFREAESPEPLDLIIVSSYAGMDGMDRANAGLRRAPPGGRSALHWYGALAELSQHHHDQFMEVLSELSDAPQDTVGLTVFEFVRASPGSLAALERAIGAERRAVVRGDLEPLAWSETGRMLVADGWDVLRIHGVRSLGDWQRYVELRRLKAPGWDAAVAARKVMIVRGIAALAIR